MKKSVMAVGVALLSGSVMASGAFDGPYVQLGIGGASTSYEPNQNYGWVGVG